MEGWISYVELSSLPLQNYIVSILVHVLKSRVYTRVGNIFYKKSLETKMSPLTIVSTGMQNFDSFTTGNLLDLFASAHLKYLNCSDTKLWVLSRLIF